MRYQIALISIAAALSTIVVSAAEPTKSDFSGEWELDVEKSEGLPPGMKQTMVVKQSGDHLDVEMKVSGPQGDRTVSDRYTLNGEETEFTPAIVGGGTPKKGKRTWRLSQDGKVLTIEMEIEGGPGPMKSKRVFVKK